MAWSKLPFGKHIEKTLPQILFSDPDWFYWALENNIFKSAKLKGEAEEIYNKSRNIRIPQKGPEKLIAEYAIHPPTKKFGQMELIPENQPIHQGSTPTSRKGVIDMAYPRKVAPYDKLGCKLLISNIKYYLFGSKSYKMTKERCEEFFNNDDNFDL